MKLNQSFLFILLFACTPAHADIMLLIHGYLGDATSWEKSGINDVLHEKNWQRAGMFRGAPEGPQLYITEHSNTDKLVYVATLPSNAPVMRQADVLKSTIDIVLQNHKNHKIILVGHSAGGVVARMALIRHQLKDIRGLITIASPHIGTGRAEQALDITANHGPFNMVKRFVGGNDYNALQSSRGLMVDLRHPQPGNMLYWLNSQDHPTIHYASVIRSDNDGALGDFYVPGFSQNMNNVPPLQGKSSTFMTTNNHFLTRQDANTILTIIDHW